MPQNEKKKIPVRRTRRKVANGPIPVKRGRSALASHVVDLKSGEPIAVATSSSSFLNSQSSRASAAQGAWPFKMYRKIAVSFVLFVLICLAVVSYFAFVKLDIAVKPKITPVAAAASFSVYDRPESYSLPPESILGLVREMDVENTASYQSSGEEAIGAEVSGSVTIFNKYIKDQPLVATTRLLSETKQLLHLKNSVVVPAGGSVSVQVYGDTSDPSFTLADSHLTIPGLWAGLQDKIYGEAKAGAVTYKEKKKITVTQADLDRAIADSKKTLTDNAAKQITDVYAAYDQKLFKLDDQSVTFSFDAKVGDEKPTVTIKMSAKVTVVAFKRQSVADLDKTALESTLGNGQSLIDAASSDASFKLVSSNTVQNIAEVELDVSGQAVVKTGADLIDRQKLVGLQRDQIESYLNSLPGIESYTLTFTPSFLHIAPQLVDRIHISTE